MASQIISRTTPHHGASTRNSNGGSPFFIQATSCIVCRGKEHEVISRFDRHGHPLDTLVCRECGLVRHQDIPSEAVLDEYYASQYRESYVGETRPSPRRVMRAWRNGRRIVNQLSPHLQPAMRVFEVGAGIGCTVKAFEQEGCLAEGIEPHLGFQQYANELVRARVQYGYLKDVADGALHDLVVLVHVIEHLRQPDQDLRRIRELLAPGGLLYVECPNLAAPFARRSRMFHYAHIHNFTPDTLGSLVEQSGFRLVRRFASNAGDQDPNLQMLFERDAPRRYESFGGYRKTMLAIGRLNPLTYFCRPNYVARSAHRFANVAWESLTARSHVKKLERSWSA